MPLSRHSVSALRWVALSLPLAFFLAGCPSADECEGCLLGGVCFPDGVANPANACEICRAATAPTAWSANDGVVCDDGVYCNGADSCEDHACRVHAGNPCVDDGNFCNGEESCDEASSSCAHSGDPCEDDDLFCNGTVSCSEDSNDCVETGPPCGDDALFCNGTETCNEVNDLCEHTGNPCGAGLFCDDGIDECSVVCDGCRIDNVCYDHNERNPTNPCELCDVGAADDDWTARDGLSCDDGLWCTGTEICNGTVCTHAGDPCESDETCFEDEGGQCCHALPDPVCSVDDDVVLVDNCGHALETLASCASCEDAHCVCNPVAQTGCGVGEKCAFLNGVTSCFTAGAAPVGAPCTTSDTAPDSCAAGGVCINDVCTEICSTAPDSCPSDKYCSSYAGLFSDLTDVGACVAMCDPVAQDCPVDEACYLLSVTGLSTCAGVPAYAVGITQGDPCYGPDVGLCYLNGCDEGYGANLPDSTCAFFCSPVDNYLGHTPGLAGDPGGVNCASTFADRPDGPGAGYECRYIQSFYSNTEEVAETIGMCVSVAEWGSCADFDFDQLILDWGSGLANEQSYCTDHPERCMLSCISLATADAAHP